jgi:hypothetical protein
VPIICWVCCWPINHFSDLCLDNKVVTMTLDTNTYVISNPIGHFVAFVKALHASNPVLVEVDGKTSTGPHLDDGNAVILSKIKAIHSTEDEKYLLLAMFSDANAGVLLSTLRTPYLYCVLNVCLYNRIMCKTNIVH